MDQPAVNRPAFMRGLLKRVEDEGRMGAVRLARQPAILRAWLSMTKAT
jgi:hypothetical protein